MFKASNRTELSPEQIATINKRHQVILDRIDLVNKLRRDERYRHINFFEHFAKDLILNETPSR